MQGSGNKSGMSLVLETTAAVATIAAGVAAVFALKDKDQVIAVGVICALILVSLAVHTGRQGSKGAAWALATIALLVMGYSGIRAQSIEASEGAFVDSPTPPATTRPPTSPDTVENSVPEASEPVFEGTVEMTKGEAVDLEVSSPNAQLANDLTGSNDVLFDGFSFAWQHEGYLLMYTGNPQKGEEGCRELLASGNPAQAAIALINQWYCARTSEGRIALLKIQGNAIQLQITSLSYKVWDP